MTSPVRLDYMYTLEKPHCSKEHTISEAGDYGRANYRESFFLYILSLE